MNKREKAQYFVRTIKTDKNGKVTVNDKHKVRFDTLAVQMKEALASYNKAGFYSQILSSVKLQTCKIVDAKLNIVEILESVEVKY